MKLYCILKLSFDFICAEYVGDVEITRTGVVESLVRYHSDKIEPLTLYRKPVKRQFQVGSLTGAVAS